MLNFPVAFAVAAVLGILAGMGIGGGSLLLLWLTQIAMLPQEQARILNLLFYLPAAILSLFLRRKEAPVQWAVVLPAAIAGCIATAAFSALTKHIDIAILKKLLGALLLFTGIRELCYRPRNAR